MNVKKAIKSIAAVAVGALMVGSAVLGATNLNAYPSNMITDGAFNGKIVIGLKASPQDVIAAIDIATSLQAASVKESTVSVAGSAASYTVEGGVSLKKSNEALSPVIESIFSSKATIDSSDSEIFGDETLVNDDTNDEITYSQKLTLPSAGAIGTGAFVQYNKDNSDFDDPTLYLNMPTSAYNSGYLWSFAVSFDNAVNVTEYANNEVLTLMGEQFFISPDQSSTSVLKLTKAAEEVTVGLNEEVEISGHKISLLGSTDAGKITIKIDGITKTAEDGDTVAVGGVNFFIKDVFVQTMPADNVIAVVSVGSDEIELDFTANDLSLNGDKVDGYVVTKDGTNTQALDGFTIAFNPRDSELDKEYVLEGESIKDPIFGLEVAFGGLTQELDDASKVPVNFEASGKELKIDFVNAEGDEINFVYMKETNADNAEELYSDLVLTGNYVADSKYFFTKEVVAGDADKTYQFQADDVSLTDGTAYVKLKDIGKGDTVEVKSGKEIYDTGVRVVGTSAEIALSATFGGDDKVLKDTVFLVSSDLTEVTSPVTIPAADATLYYVYQNVNGDMIPFTVGFTTGTDTAVITVDEDVTPGQAGALANLFGATTVDLVDNGVADCQLTFTAGKLYTVTGRTAVDSTLVTKGGALITLDTTAADPTTVTVTEDSANDFIDKFTAGSLDVLTVTMNNDVDFEPKLIAIAGTADGDYNTADDNNDYEYGLSSYGTYYKFDVDGDKDSLNIFYPMVEQNVIATVGKDATVSSSSSAAGSVTSTKVNAIPVGVAISDEDAMSYVGKSNLIVVGGPVVNTVMAKLKNNPSSEQIAAEYKPGVGLVELYDKTNFAELGNTVALLVSGYEWQDTQRAARAVAQHSDANFKGTAVEVQGTSTSISSIKAVSNE